MAETKTSQKQRIKERFKLIFQLLFLVFVKSVFNIISTVANRLNPYGEKQVKDKLIAISGAGKGLGRQLAIDFAKLGSKIACIDPDVEANENTADVINKVFPNHARIYDGDVKQLAELKTIWEDILYNSEKIDILIIADSTVTGGHTLPNTTDDEFHNTLNTNFVGPFQVIRQFLLNSEPKNPGQIVIISSSVGLSSVEKGAVYTALEWARIGLAEGIYKDLRRTSNNNIKITTVCPYFIDYGAKESPILNLRIGPIPLEDVSQSIISGIRRERRIFTVPGYIYYSHVLRKLLPDSINDALNDILYTKFENQSALEKPQKIDKPKEEKSANSK